MPHWNIYWTLIIFFLIWMQRRQMGSECVGHGLQSDHVFTGIVCVKLLVIHNVRKTIFFYKGTNHEDDCLFVVIPWAWWQISTVLLEWKSCQFPPSTLAGSCPSFKYLNVEYLWFIDHPIGDCADLMPLDTSLIKDCHDLLRWNVVMSRSGIKQGCRETQLFSFSAQTQVCCAPMYRQVFDPIKGVSPAPKGIHSTRHKKVACAMKVIHEH